MSLKSENLNSHSINETLSATLVLKAPFYKLSDGLGWQSEIVKNYCISNSSTLILLNHDLKILEKSDSISEIECFLKKNSLNFDEN